MNRIVIIGTSCSGKTTLAKIIASKLNIKHIELDQLYWKPNWVEHEANDFRSLVIEEIKDENWVADGNYSVIRDVLWSRSTIIIWLNYSFSKVLYRSISRSFRRSLTKEIIFSGNTDSFKRSFFSRDSIILWVIKTHKSKHEKYSRILYNGSMPKKNIIELKSQSETNQYINDLSRLDN